MLFKLIFYESSKFFFRIIQILGTIVIDFKGVTILNQTKSNTKNPLSWLIQFFKGMLIGSGAILPGVSGGALAAIFGLYEPIINFLSNIRKNFLKNILYFVPIGLGALFGIFVLATPIDYGLQYYPVHVLWGFVGAIFGTMPSLYKEAGKEGRETKHIVIAIVTAVVAFAVLTYANRYLNVDVPQNTLSWLMAGGIFASGLIVPGLSPSNFLIYFNLYQPLTEGIRTLDWSIIIPVGIGAVVIVLAFSKLMRKIMDIAYASVFHFIFGVVVASTVIIIPDPALYQGFEMLDYLIVALIFALGFGLGYWMGHLEEKYK